MLADDGRWRKQKNKEKGDEELYTRKSRIQRHTSDTRAYLQIKDIPYILPGICDTSKFRPPKSMGWC
jgi:hypothetical protein